MFPEVIERKDVLSASLNRERRTVSPKLVRLGQTKDGSMKLRTMAC